MKHPRIIIVLLSALFLAACDPGAVARGAGHEARVTSHGLHALLAEANAAFQQANAANDPEAARQSYGKAVLLYEKIIDQGGIQNAGLYYNLANAYLLTDDIGRAIANYRRAERLDDSDLNVKKNLAFARGRRIDRVEVGTQTRVLETLFFWHYDLSLRTKLLLACLAFGAMCVAGTVLIWRGRGAAGLTALAVSGVLAAGLLASILIETHKQSAVRFGVITAAEIVARQGDGPNYPPSFKDPLHAGTEFELLEQRPGWFHIRLSDGTDTWIPDDAAEAV
jgi:tetratricopeptide (TPR) repeat protein